MGAEGDQPLERLLGIETPPQSGVLPHDLAVQAGVLQGHRGQSGECFEEQLGVSGPVMLFFGYIRGYKGLKILLQAFAMSLEKIQSTLLIVGEFYEDPEPYKALMDRLSIGDKIILVDRYVPNEEVEVYFTACDLVVLPYLTATQSGIVQISYGFCKPVIVTGQRQVEGDDALFPTSSQFFFNPSV